jgi:Enoyl-CoA hydratase/isomerase
MTERVRLTIIDGVADVRLDRADKMNALDPAMFEALAETDARLRDDSGVRAVVQSGEGGAFCAGLDVDRLTAAAAGKSILPFVDLTRRTHGIANFAQHVVWIWREIPAPVRSFTASLSAAASNSRSAPICVMRPPARVSGSSRRSGAWCRIWPGRSSCATLRAKTWCVS